jgi:polyisoprenoid-binding protein YceI
MIPFRPLCSHGSISELLLAAVLLALLTSDNAEASETAGDIDQQIGQCTPGRMLDCSDDTVSTTNVSPELATPEGSLSMAEALRIVPARSEVLFRIGLMLFFDARGHFGEVNGEIEREPGTVRVSARIPVASAHMDSERYAVMLKGPQFLAGDAHPWIDFRSDTLDPEQLDAGGSIPGEVCMRGVCRRETFQLHQLDCRYRAGSNIAEECEMIVSGSLQRTRYGMRSHRGALKNQIELRMRLVAVQTALAE